MPDTDLTLDAQIETLLDREDWWQLPQAFVDQLDALLSDMSISGLNAEAGRVQGMRIGEGSPVFMSLAWDVRDPRVIELIQQHAAEMVTNVNNGTKFYLREIIKESVEEGLGTTATIERIQQDLFGLPAAEAIKFPRERIMSIVNYETNKAMSQAARLLRQQLGLKVKQWFTNNVSPCDICLGNQAQGKVDAAFQYEGVFGPILDPPAHPRTCRCVVTADEAEVLALGTGPINWPMTVQRGQ